MAHPIDLAFRILKEVDFCFESAHRAAIGAMEGTPYAHDPDDPYEDDWTHQIANPEGLRQYLEHEIIELHHANHGPARDLALRFSEILTNWDNCQQTIDWNAKDWPEDLTPEWEEQPEWHEGGWNDVTN